MKIFIDVHPNYQPAVDWKLLVEKGVTGVIIKSGQGLVNYPNISAYATPAKQAGLIVGFYHWVDPIYSAADQMKKFAQQLELPCVDFGMLDYEQWWSDWNKWTLAMQGKLDLSQVPRFDKKKHAPYLNLLQIASAQYLKKPYLLYTANWFITGYTSDAVPFLNKFKTNFASYPYPNGRISLSWEDFLKNHLPTTSFPLVPAGVDKKNVLMWQFSGDRFCLPGIYSDLAKTKVSPVDLNFILGDLNDFLGRSEEKPDCDTDCHISDRLSDVENRIGEIRNSLSVAIGQIAHINDELEKLLTDIEGDK